MIASKEAAAEKCANEKCALPSAGELRVIREELSRLMPLSPGELVARLDIEVATRSFRALIREVEEEGASGSLRADAAVTRYDAFCEARRDAAFAAGPPSSPATVHLGLEVLEIVGSIKWFDAAKGYGFITPDNGLDDVLLHVTCLRSGGYQTAYGGARVRCEVLRRPRGMQAFRILEMDQSTALHPSQMLRNTHVVVRAESGWEPATVKWFNRVRGFGYLALGDDHPDVFVHMETLRRFGFAELRPGQSVEVRWGRGSKGLMAAELRPAGAPGACTH